MLNYEYPPLGGGAANANQYLLEGYTDLDGLEVDLVTASSDGYREESLGENVRIYRLDVSKDAVHYWTQAEVLRYSWRAFRKSRELVGAVEYDLVHAWFGVPSGVIARGLGLPYIVALRGSDVPGYNERFAWQYAALRPLIRHVWGEAEAIVANSSGLRDLALETRQIDIDVIPNGVALDEFEPRYHVRETLQVLCVSRLVARKGIRYLVEAARSVDVELTIVGEGDREEALKRQAADLGLGDRVTFAGYVPHDRIGSYYEEADVFVLPSFNEGMSNTMLEAMAAGLPVVTTDTGGTEELVDGNGFVVPAGDAEAIANALAAYADDPDRRRNHGRRSREIAARMDWTSMADAYRETYRRVVE